MSPTPSEVPMPALIAKEDTALDKNPGIEGVREDHASLRRKGEALEAAMGVRVEDRDRYRVLAWTLKSLWPELELHLRKEKEVLLPALARLAGKGSGSLTMLRREHACLQDGLRHLAELLQDPFCLEWDRIELAVDGFLCLLEEHAKIQQRLLDAPLLHHLNRAELKALETAYKKVAEKAYAEEGWPVY